jgi:hypothetical protein
MNSPQSTQGALRSRRGDKETRRHGEAVGAHFSVSPPLLVSLSNLLRVLCVLCGFFSFSLLDASAAPQEVVPVDGAPFQGELVSVDAGGRVSFRVANGKLEGGGNRSLPLNDIVRWGQPVAPRPQTIVVLDDGGQIVTVPDWVGGAAVRLVGDDVVLESDIWNEVRLPRGQVSGIVFAQQIRPGEREKFVERVRGDRPAVPSDKANSDAGNDMVTLMNGDRLTGTIAELDRGSLAIKALGRVVKLPLARVETIQFERSRQPSAVSPPRDTSPGEGIASQKMKGLAIGLRDGSLVYVSAIKADAKELAIKLRNGVKLSGGTVDDVVGIQSLDGQIVYLSDLEGADYRSVPYFTIKWPYTRDRDVLSEPIVVRGKRYLKGIGMHSASRLTYRLDGDYRRFDSAVAIDDSARGQGSVTFGVYVLRDGKWSEVYKSDIVRGGEAPQPFSVDLQGARGLTLTVDFADRGDELDHAVWLNARLVR